METAILGVLVVFALSIAAWSVAGLALDIRRERAQAPQPPSPALTPGETARGATAPTQDGGNRDWGGVA